MAAGYIAIVGMGACTGNRAILHGASSAGAAAAGFVPSLAITGCTVQYQFTGDIGGFITYPFWDPDTGIGLVMPNDAKTLQVGMTQGGASATLAHVIEEIYDY